MRIYKGPICNKGRIFKSYLHTQTGDNIPATNYSQQDHAYSGILGRVVQSWAKITQG